MTPERFGYMLGNILAALLFSFIIVITIYNLVFYLSHKRRMNGAEFVMRFLIIAVVIELVHDLPMIL